MAHISASLHTQSSYFAAAAAMQRTLRILFLSQFFIYFFPVFFSFLASLSFPAKFLISPLEFHLVGGW